MSVEAGNAPAQARPRKLKVYGGNLDGINRAIMACHSYKEFHAATRIGRDYGCQTANADEVAQAMSDPGTVFKRQMTTNPPTGWIVHRAKREVAQHEQTATHYHIVRLRCRELHHTASVAR